MGSSPVIGSDGTIYTGSWGDAVYALTADGELLWKYTTGSTAYATPALDAADTVYTGKLAVLPLSCPVLRAVVCWLCVLLICVGCESVLSVVAARSLLHSARFSSPCSPFTPIIRSALLSR